MSLFALLFMAEPEPAAGQPRVESHVAQLMFCVFIHVSWVFFELSAVCVLPFQLNGAFCSAA